MAVLGVYGTETANVASSIYYGLYALQHRGQASCGIVVNDDVSGFYLTNGDTFAKVVYLGKNDSTDNWHEVTEAEKEQAEAEQELNTDG